MSSLQEALAPWVNLFEFFASITAPTVDLQRKVCFGAPPISKRTMVRASFRPNTLPLQLRPPHRPLPSACMHCKTSVSVDTLLHASPHERLQQQGNKYSDCRNCLAGAAPAGRFAGSKRPPASLSRQGLRPIF